jgi:tetratricopeptide (TPR) repeat protein
MSRKFRGMTVNERLYASNLMDKFDEAVKKKDVATVISLLEEVELTKKSIVPVVENLRLCGEMYQYKRKNFIDNTLQYFSFLETEFAFSEPKQTFYKQKNGTVTSDTIAYENISLNRIIEVSNDYHPYDYGFQINIIDTQSGTKVMLSYVLKEKQDIKQEYLIEQAEVLRDYCKKVITNESEKLKRVKYLEAELWKDSENMERRGLEIIEILEDVLKQNPLHPVALTNLGAMYSNFARYDESLELLHKAKQLHFKDRNLYYNLGVVSIGLKREREAKKYFKTSAKMESNALTFEAYIDFHAL